MKLSRRSGRLLGFALATTLALTACGDGGTEEPDANVGGGEAGASAEATGNEMAGELQDKMVGAMEDYGVGTTFKASEPVEFNFLYRDHPNYPYQEDWLFFEELEKNQNVTFDLVNVPLSDWSDRRALLISAGDAPDVIPSTYTGEAEQYAASGALLPISDYLDYLPNFTEKVEKWGLQEDLDLIRLEDGKFYSLPGLHEKPKPTYSFAIREDLFEKAGITEDPATFEEFAEQMKAVQEANPELDYVYTERWSASGPLDATLSFSAPNFGTTAGWGYGARVTYKDGEYVYTGASDEYRDLVAYFAGLVEDGLLDPESVSQDDDTAIQKFTSGQAAVIGSNDQEILRYRQTLEESGNTEASLRQIVVPAGPAGSIMDGARFESGVAFTKGAAEKEHFVALLQFVDWLFYSDEGLEFAKWGVEGVTYNKDEEGNRTLAENIDINGLNPGAPEMLNTDYGFHNGVFMPAHGSTTDLVQSMLRDEVKEWLNKMYEKDLVKPGPRILYDELENEEAVLMRTPLQDTTMQNTAAFIVGQKSMDEWDAHVAELESKGMQRYIDMVNENVVEG